MAYKNWRKRSGDENVRAGQAIYTHVFHLLWYRLKSVDAIQNFRAEDRCDEREQGKIDDGEKEFGGWVGNVFLMEKMARELFAVAFWQPTGRHAAITLECLNFAAFKARACADNRSWFQCSVAARLINENGWSNT